MLRAGSRLPYLALAALAFPSGQAVAQDGTWALTNARIETVTRGVIERGTIVIRDGLIAAVGADVTAPADARVLDLAGRTVYPGVIDLTSTLGLPAPPAGGGGPGQQGPAGQQGQQQPQFVGLEPERLVTEELRFQAADVRAARDAGITAVLTAPGRGAFRGQSALIPLHDSAISRRVIRAPVAQHMGFQGVGGGFGGGRYPGTLLGVMAYERQELHDARRQALLQERYRGNPRGMRRPESDPALDALVPVVQGRMPVFIAANNEGEIRRALGLAREFNLQATLVGATEAFRAVDALRASRRPVVVSVDYPQAPQVTGWQYRGAQRTVPDSAAADSMARRIVEGNAAALHQAGVRFALASGGTRAADFFGNVRKAIAAGLHRDTALAAITIRAAEIAGAEQQLGSIEQGKIANLVVAGGDLLGDSARIQMVFVDGQRYTVEPPARAAGGPLARGGRPGAGGATEPVQMAGTWDLIINSPQGNQAVVMTTTQSGATFSGTMRSDLGTSEIVSGAITGRRLTWSMSLTISGQQMQLHYSAEVDGTRMTGSVAVGEFGTFQFTGEKRP